MAEIRPANDYNRVSDYLAKSLVGAGIGVGVGGVVNKLIGKKFLHPLGIVGGGLIGGAGGLGVAYHKDINTNRFAGNDFSGDHVYAMQMPLVGGLFPSATHTCLFATLSPASYSRLPAAQKEKWKCVEHKGKKVYFRGITNSYGKSRSLGSVTGRDLNCPSFSDRSDADDAIANYLIRGLQPGDLRARASDPSSLVSSTLSLPPSHVGRIKLNPNGTTPMGIYINDMLNEGAEYIASRRLPYNMSGWNCHTGVVDALTHNKHVAPGYFSMGGLRGASGRTGELPNIDILSKFIIDQGE